MSIRIANRFAKGQHNCTSVSQSLQRKGIHAKGILCLRFLQCPHKLFGMHTQSSEYTQFVKHPFSASVVNENFAKTQHKVGVFLL